MRFISRVIEDLRNNKRKNISLWYFLHKGLNTFGLEGRDALTKEMNQIYEQNCFEPIPIKEFTPEGNRRTQ